MDSILNKPMKDEIAGVLDEDLLVGAEETDDSIGRRRILITQAAGQAWLWLHGGKDSIIKSFKQAGISISPDGTEIIIITAINNAMHKQEVRGHVHIR